MSLELDTLTAALPEHLRARVHSGCITATQARVTAHEDVLARITRLDDARGWIQTTDAVFPYASGAPIEHRVLGAELTSAGASLQIVSCSGSWLLTETTYDPSGEGVVIEYTHRARQGFDALTYLVEMRTSEHTPDATAAASHPFRSQGATR